VKPIIIKVIMLALASVAALLGLSMLVFGFTLFLPHSTRSGEAFMIGFSVFGILLGLYYSYIGFLGWFRFSPRAVRHILGTLAFMLFGTLGGAAHRFESADSPELSALYSLGGGLVLYLLYRWVVSYCCRHLFPAPSHGLHPPPLPGCDR
jgi:hypothetical protein